MIHLDYRTYEGTLKTVRLPSWEESDKLEKELEELNLNYLYIHEEIDLEDYEKFYEE